MEKSKKPPDKYKTIKYTLDSILAKDKNKKTILDEKILFNAVFRTHQVIIHTYQFLRLWILDKYHNNKDISIITDDTIKMAFKVLVKSSQGPKPKGSNLKLYDEFTTFYNDQYCKLNYDNKLDGSNLSSILDYSSTDMLTNIENNIKLNFTKYVRRFVNSSFKKINNEILEKADKGQKTKLRKELNKDLSDIKNDLFDNTLLSNNKYHNWIKKHKDNIIPKDITNSIEFDINNNPQKYIKNMIYMCLEIEKLETKSFQFFPLRNNIILKNCPIDTKSLIELFINEDKNKYLSDIEGCKEILWNQYFNLNHPIFKQNNYSFDYRISTDCYSVSIQMIHKDYIEKEKDKKSKMKNKRAEMKKIYKNMTHEEKEKYKSKLNDNKKQEQLKIKLKLKEDRDKEKKEFKKLSKEEQNKIKDKIAKEKISNKEFPYLEDLNEKQLEELKNNNWVCCDPGKRILFYMKNKNGIRFRYSNRQYVNDIKRLKYQRLLKNHKEKQNISKIENELSNYNSKTCNYESFKNFIKTKNKLNEVLLQKYCDQKFRKYKWYSYINKKKTESKIIKSIKNKFGKNAIINYGDWNANGVIQMRNFISTPNLRLKKKLAEQMKVYNLDEFRTSKLNYKTEEICEHLSYADKKGTIRELHSVLTYQTEKKSKGCINRDENSVNNMIKIVKYYLEHKKRPIKYTREYDLDNKKIKDSNPKIGKQLGSNTIKPEKVQLHRFTKKVSHFSVKKV